MPKGTVTFTGKTGPAKSLTATVFSNVESIELNIKDGRLTLKQSSPDRFVNLELTSIATLTDTITANNHVIAIST